MAPAQLCVGISPDSRSNSITKMPVGKENMGLLRHTSSKGMRCISNCEDAMSGMEAYLQKHTMVPEIPINEQVDIIECSNAKKIRLVEIEDPDATEYSSSFGGTVSENGGDGFSEAEVESRFWGDDNLASTFDPFHDVFPMRKKKVTSHWRRFIRPLMWRCRWTELRINEIQSRGLSYARKLAAHDRLKPIELNQSALDGFASKSMPISSQYSRKRAMKRRKRRRVEDTDDLASSMSRHNLFSYIENKKANPDASMADDFGNPVITDQNVPENDEFGTNEDQSFFELSGGENSLEGILLKIERTYTRVQNLKTQLGNVLLEHGGRFSSSENLSLLGHSDGSEPSPPISAGNDDSVSMGAIYHSTIDSQHITEYDMGDNIDLILPKIEISDYEEANHIPDVIESTVGLLSAADVTFPHPQIGDSCETIVDTERHELKRGEQEESSKAKSTVSHQESTLKSSLASELNFPKNKRKRGERKAGPGAWTSKNSADPDI